jgi:hypothetical protein
VASQRDGLGDRHVGEALAHGRVTDASEGGEFGHGERLAEQLKAQEPCAPAHVTAEVLA